MKLLHFSDVHIGHEIYGKTDSKTGLNTRLLDFLARLDEVVEKSKEVDLVVFAGDAFKTRDPSLTYQREFAKRILKMSQQTPVVMIIGNHDVPPSLGKADTLEIFSALEVPNVYIFSKPEIKEILISKNQQPITIVALPWLSKNVLLAEKEKHLPAEKARMAAEQKIIQIWEGLLKKINPGQINIGVIHQTLSGAVFSKDRETYLGNDPIIPVSVLANKRLSYVAVGHLHKYQPLNENPPVIYSGSLERIDFGESKDKKGFVVAEILKGKSAGWRTKFKFIETKAREFKIILIKIPENEKLPNQYVLNQIKKQDFANAILRIELEGKETSISQIIDSDIKEMTKKAFYLAPLLKKSEEKIVQIEMNAEIITPIEWVERYLKKRNFKEEELLLIKEEAEKIFEEIS